MISRRHREQEEYLRKQEDAQKLKEALKTNTHIPHSIRGNAKELLDEMIYGMEEEEIVHPLPRIAVTTSHKPSSQLKSFAKHMSLIFNGSHVMRGGMSATELSEYSREQEITHMIILGETRGTPSSLQLCKFPTGPTYHFTLFNVRYQRRQKPVGEKAFLVIDGMQSKTGQDLREALALCFPKTEAASRVVAVINRKGTVAFRHYLVEDRKLAKETEFDMRLFKVVNSTLEVDGEVEFAVKSHMNSTNNDVLGDENEGQVH